MSVCGCLLVFVVYLWLLWVVCINSVVHCDLCTYLPCIVGFDVLVALYCCFVDCVLFGGFVVFAGCYIVTCCLFGLLLVVGGFVVCLTW